MPITSFLATPTAGGGLPQMLMMIVPMFAIFYFLLIRPQQKQQKAFREMISNVGRGDEIVTSGGIKAKVIKATDEKEIEIEIAPEVRVRLNRSGIASIVNSKNMPPQKAPSKNKKSSASKEDTSKKAEDKKSLISKGNDSKKSNTIEAEKP